MTNNRIEYVVRIVNSYFFDEDEITLSDALWFYGVTIFIALIGLTFLVLHMIH